jgi:hypothetical protein
MAPTMKILRNKVQVFGYSEFHYIENLLYIWVTRFSSWRPGIMSRAVHVGLLWTNWHWDRFLSKFLSFRCEYHSTAAPYSLVYHLGFGQWAP